MSFPKALIRITYKLHFSTMLIASCKITFIVIQLVEKPVGKVFYPVIPSQPLATHIEIIYTYLLIDEEGKKSIRKIEYC